MQVGISTASLFLREKTEGALKILSDNKIKCAEVFLESFCEYNKDFGKILKQVKGDIDVHSVHILTTQVEPQLYSVNERANVDSFKILDEAMACAEEIKAKYYSFHGVTRMKVTPLNMNFERIGKYTNKIMDTCLKHGVTLAYENVHWAYYNYIGFFSELKKYVPNLKGTLDIKQARQSKISHNEYLKEMGKDIVTVHLSDIDKNGKMCLPGRGITDFKDLFTRLNDVGFDGAILLEVYPEDYLEYSELFESMHYVEDLAKRHIKR